MTEVTISANAVIANTAILAYASVSALFTFFLTLFADQDTLGTAPAAFTYVFRAEFTQQTFGAVVPFSTKTVKAGTAVGTKLIFCAVHALFIAQFAAAGAFRTALSAIADPVRTADTQHTLGAIQLISRTFGADAAIVADKIYALRAFFAAHVADVAGRFITATTLFITFTAILKAITAIIAHFVVIVAGTAVATVMLLVAAAVSSLAAMISVITFPIVIAPSAAIFTFNAVLIVRTDGNCDKRYGIVKSIFAKC